MNTSPIIDDDFKGEKGHIEVIQDIDHSDANLDVKDTIKGTVGLTSEGGAVVLIPTPSADPSAYVDVGRGATDPLNMSWWRKWTLVVILSTYYIKANKGYQDITNLITVPTLSMGIGNLVFIPIALAVGRRPVFIFSCALLFVGCIVASQVTNYEYHLAIRIVIGFAAGQSEALVPLMLKEVFFLHERANVLSFQASFQTIVGCVLTIFASNIAASVGWKNWYSVYAGLSGFLLIAAYFFVPETAYERPLSAYTGHQEAVPTLPTDLATLESQLPVATTQSNRPALDEDRYGRKTLRRDVRLFSKKLDWMEAYLLLKHCLEMCFFPNMLVIILMNSWYLGVNIGMGTTYATLLEAPPYNWAPKWVGVAQAGQIVVAFIALPALGIFSDKLITYMAKRNEGVHEPETRLIPLAFPVALGVLSTVLFGAGYAHPEKFHWFVIIFSYCGSYFAFIAASVAGQTYLLDCYPTRSGAVLTLVCAARGIISFGLTYSLVPTTTKLGYMKAYGMYAGVMALFALLAVGLYFKGKAVRTWTMRWIKDDGDKTKPHYG
ncbi:hypothetical protein QFC20_006450 [Naganishia adeliensis]|uniref:Uncharacterized protein n=1 Tax=Naganishia adeliensis TaxID=92952 RepID=A0ACC2VBH4_9TREE|nr:hypothetical protein QFC20_006450 [Naganishia adeliensis]